VSFKAPTATAYEDAGCLFSFTSGCLGLSAGGISGVKATENSKAYGGQDKRMPTDRRSKKEALLGIRDERDTVGGTGTVKVMKNFVVRTSG